MVDFLKRYGLTILKFAISFGILGYLFHQTQQDEAFTELTTSPKHWSLLLLSLLLALAAISLTFLRWYWLVRALDLPFRVLDAFRLGFIGFLFNFLTLGPVGGDALKAVFVARQIPRRKPEVVATVLIDRFIGLLVLFVIASVALMALDLSATSDDPSRIQAVQTIRWIVFSFAIAGGCMVASLYVLPNIHRWRLTARLFALPVVGRLFERLLQAGLMYRSQPQVIGGCMLISVLVHMLNTLAVFLVACGLSIRHPDLGTHLAIVPISMVAGAVPLPGGLGAFEAMLHFLYSELSSDLLNAKGGFIVALGFRVITLIIAAIGVGVYLAGKRELAQLMSTARQPTREVTPG